jgi:hypothetical protein
MEKMVFSIKMLKKSVTISKKIGGQIGHEGSNLKLVSNPTDTKEYPAPENCEKCNQSLFEIKAKSKVGQEYTLPKMEISIIEHKVESISETASLDILKMYDKAILMGFQENPDIDIGKRRSSSKVVNLLRRMDRYKEDILKFLFTTDVPFDNNLAKKSTEDVQS